MYVYDKLWTVKCDESKEIPTKYATIKRFGHKRFERDEHYLSRKVVCHSADNGSVSVEGAIVVNLKVWHDPGLLKVEDNHQGEPESAKFALERSK